MKIFFRSVFRERIRHLTDLKGRIFLAIVFVYCFLPAAGQNCDVDFPGTALRDFSSTCGGSSSANLELGKNTYMGDGDIFTFDLPIINISGNIHVNAQGNGKIIIPAGVTVNLDGNFKIDPKNSGCSSANPCIFEIEVNGYANFTDDFESNLVTLVWTGTGTVVVGDDFKNSSNGCMECGAGGCPNFQVNSSDCSDNGSGCSGGDFCTKISACSSDTAKPIITGCPSDQVVDMTGPGCTQPVSWTPPTASDNCTLLPLTESHTPDTPFPKGTTIVTYTATDLAGNFEKCTFTVTVVDIVPPVITGSLPDIFEPANASCKATVTWPTPNATDNCGTPILSCTPPSGSLFSVGTTPVTYTATDDSGRTATRTFNVIVTDNSGPIITGCKDIVVNAASSSCDTKVSWVEPSATDCGNVEMVSSHDPGQTFTLGKTVVTYTATDENGNTSSCKFNVIVEDKTAPVFEHCLTEIIVTADETCSAIATWQPPMASDNCGLATVNPSHSPGDTFPIGKTVVKYTATDNSGNVTVCQFDVLVNNKTLPAFSACPKDILIEANENGIASIHWILPTATAECGEVSLSASHQPGIFNIGTTKVEYKATDNGGNTSYCTFNVIVSQVEIKVDVGKVVTPDGNGINDHLILTNIERFQDNKVVIVDRWGGLIFTGTGYNNENVIWRGTNRSGGLVPTGTYFYTILVRFGSAKIEKSGFVELIR
jgi:gliding motility-associated-like protein